jgi:hypothetical protein
MQKLIRNKYLHSKSLSQVKSKSSDFPFWKGLMKFKEELFQRGHFNVGSGEDTCFSEDTCLARLFPNNIHPYIVQ